MGSTGTYICVRVEANANGAPATLLLTAAGNSINPISIESEYSYEYCTDLGGYGRAVNVTAQLVDASGHNRASTEVVSIPVTSSNPAWVTITNAFRYYGNQSWDKTLCVDFTYGPHDGYVKVGVVWHTTGFDYDSGTSGVGRKCWAEGTAGNNYAVSVTVWGADDNVMLAQVIGSARAPDDPSASVTVWKGDHYYNSFRNLVFQLDNFSGPISCSMTWNGETDESFTVNGNGTYYSNQMYSGAHYGRGNLYIACSGSSGGWDDFSVGFS